MEALKRIISNEITAMNVQPVTNLNVSRWAIIKGIEPKTLIDYALEQGLEKPSINKMTDCLEVTQKTPNGSIFLQSTILKVKTTYEF